MTNAYGKCKSFESTGVIRETLIELEETNDFRVTYGVRFLRNRAFRMEVDVETKYGVGPHVFTCHWDGTNWHEYDSLKLTYAKHPVESNVDVYGLAGSGIALSFGLFPELPMLLRVDPPFSGFRSFHRAEATVGRLQGKQVYRLKLIRADEDGTYNTTYDCWIDPQRFIILQDTFSKNSRFQNYVTIVERETRHSPRVDTLPANAPIEFSPPEQPSVRAARE